MERASRARKVSEGRKTSPPMKPMSPIKTVKEKSPSRSTKSKSATRKKSPGRSRSRSAARKKALNKLEDVKDVPQNYVNSVKQTKEAKSVSPTKSFLAVSNAKDAVERIRQSLSPDSDSFIRRSLSRFEELTSDVVRRSVTPRSVTTREVGTRSSLRLKSQNSIKPVGPTQQEFELIDEKFSRNHVGSKKEDAALVDRNLKIVFSLFLVLLIAAISTITVAAHVACSRDDCRLVVPDINKFSNYKLYFDPYLWPGLTVGVMIIFSASHYLQHNIRKAPYLSLLGLACLLFLLSSLNICHFYFAGLKNLKLLPFVSASLLHIFIFAVLSANSPVLLGVKLNSYILRLSAIITIIIDGYISASETYRGVPNPAVFILAGLQALYAADSLVFEPILNESSPVYNMLLVLRPLILVLLPVYISANNIRVHAGLIVAVVFLYLVGYFLYRYSLYLKGSSTLNPYSQRNIKGHVYGEYSAGPWKVVRHPDLLGRLILEIGWAISTVSTPVSYAFLALIVISTGLEGVYLDRFIPRHSRASKHSVIPLVY